MIETNTDFSADLMEVVRLFAGAEALDIVHECGRNGALYWNRFRVGGQEFSYEDAPVSRCEQKALVKRTAKLALYRLLSQLFRKSLPWGALTGIRPTKLAYEELLAGRDFGPLFREMCVSQENIDLVRRVIAGQEGIFRKRAGDCDLYVSLPFCPTRCVYCSFITAPIGRTRQYLPDYLTALERELNAAAPLIGNLRSVYIGGGTPFVLEAEELERTLKAVAPLRGNDCEYTVEAGRADVFTEEKLRLCKEYGVTRICINAQSFSDKTLEAIGRKHTAEQVERAFELARPFGFTLNCDLIAGLTGESKEEFCASVDRAIALAPENITVHTLCLKKGARLKEEVGSLGDGELDGMIAYSRAALTAAGYEPYYLYRQKYMAGAHENVGWTKRGYASVYNIDVMEEIADNLAVGANAITKRLFAEEDRIERLGSPKDIPTYLQKVDRIIAEKNKLFART